MLRGRQLESEKPKHSHRPHSACVGCPHTYTESESLHTKIPQFQCQIDTGFRWPPSSLRGLPQPAAQIAEIERNMTDDYRAHKKAMHRPGARAASSDDPGPIRHLRKSSLADVLALECRARAGEAAALPKPPAVDAPTYCFYWYIRRRSRRTFGDSASLG